MGYSYSGSLVVNSQLKKKLIFLCLNHRLVVVKIIGCIIVVAQMWHEAYIYYKHYYWKEEIIFYY